MGRPESQSPAGLAIREPFNSSAGSRFQRCFLQDQIRIEHVDIQGAIHRIAVARHHACRPAAELLLS